MEAPKVIWYDGVSRGRFVRHEPPYSDIHPDQRYIRADAPELVALVEALRNLSDVVCDLGLDASGHTLSAINKADKAHAAWEALTNE